MNITMLTEDMFSTGKPFAQGEVLIWLKKYAPQSVLDGLANLKDFVEMPLEHGKIILGHSETGHCHVLKPVSKDVPMSMAAQALINKANDNFLALKVHHECALIHERDVDAHQAVILPPGDYIRTIREEQTVRGWQRVQD